MSAEEPPTVSLRIDHDVFGANKPVREIFLDVLRNTGARGGFAQFVGCTDLPKGHLDVKKGITVRDAMDALVAANPGYQWDMEDGVVNLMPRRGVPLLNTIITKFHMEATDQEAHVFFQDLLTVPEVQQREAALGLKKGLGQGGPTSVPKHPVPKKHLPVSINVQNLTLQESFNKIVGVLPKGVWLYYETDCNGAKTYIVDVASDY